LWKVLWIDILVQSITFESLNYRMENIKYSYSKGQTWFAFIILLALIIFCVYKIITDSPDDNIWEPLVPFILFLGAVLGYVCFKFFFPLLRGETILQLNKENLQYFPRNRIIYWKDIESMDYVIGAKSGSWAIRFAMKDGTRTRISTKYVAGNNQGIYDTIVEHFKKYR